MQKADPQHKPSYHPPQPAQRQGASRDAPQGERLAQLAAMAQASPQATRLAQLAATADAGPRAAAQRGATAAIHRGARTTAQRQAADAVQDGSGLAEQREDVDEPLQAKVAQRAEAPAKPNNTGLPDKLKSGIESLSGMSMDNVRVHYNSSQPAQLNAHAYAQGTEIHVAPGQERHLPHEAWHVVQQAQGRVRPTMQMKGDVPVNDEVGLEREADEMGERAMSGGTDQSGTIETLSLARTQPRNPPPSAEGKLIQKWGGGDNKRLREDDEDDADYSPSSQSESEDSMSDDEEVDNSLKERPSVVEYDPLADNFTNTNVQEALEEQAGNMAKVVDRLMNPTKDEVLFKKSKRNKGGIDLPTAFKDAAEHVDDLVEVLRNFKEFYASWDAEEQDETNEHSSWSVARKAFNKAINGVKEIEKRIIELLEKEEGTQKTYKELLSKISGAVTALIGGDGGWGGPVGRAENDDSYPQDASSITDGAFFDSWSKTIGRSTVKPKARASAKSSDVIKVASQEYEETADRPKSDPLAGLPVATPSESVDYTAKPATQDRGNGQAVAMNNTTAKGYAWYSDVHGWMENRWEWLHVKAAQLGGETTAHNLVLGTRDANTMMMPFESFIATLSRRVKRNNRILDRLSVTWKLSSPVTGSTHVYNKIDIKWVLHPVVGAADHVKTVCDDASGEVSFSPMYVNTILMQSEVRTIMQELATITATVPPRETE